MRVLPIAGPGDVELGFVSGNTVEELTSIVVLAEIGNAGCSVDRHEVRAVEVAGEVFGDGAAKGSAGVEGDEKYVEVRGRVKIGGRQEGFGIRGERRIFESGKGDEVRAFVL